MNRRTSPDGYVQALESEGGKLREKIQTQEALIQELVEQRKATPGKIPLGEFPETERFAQLYPESKHFIDTIKKIAYQAESAMAGQLADHLSRQDDRRALLRRRFTTPVNLRPDPETNTLTVEVHRLGSPLQDAAIQRMSEILTETETVFPTTQLRLIYRQVGSFKFQPRSGCLSLHTGEDSSEHGTGASLKVKAGFQRGLLLVNDPSEFFRQHSSIGAAGPPALGLRDRDDRVGPSFHNLWKKFRSAESSS